MPQPAFKQVAELFNEAVALPPSRRPAFLDAACAGDADLRAAVESLLRHDADATDILRGSPVARQAAEAREDAPTLAPTDGAGSPGPLPRVTGYELLRELGRGGMGVVYLARHVHLKRLVALKMLPATLATPELVARFRTEAEALARLQHPNIVPIYDVGEFEGHPYFTMEYVDGPSLAALLDGRPQDVEASARLVELLAGAAHAVHQVAIIHRDLKPANVLLQAPGLQPGGFTMPKITDFGIAMDLTSARRLTQAGSIMGTPCYMAPEQVRNTRGGVGPSADVYSLGSILYELLTGRPPFDAPTALETIAQVLNQEPLSPSRLRPRLPRDLVTICLKCLEKSPRRRYASAWELAEDLRRFRAGEPIRARPVGAVGHAYRWCLRRPLVAGLLALSGALALGFVATVVVYDALLRAALANQVEEGRQEIVQLNVTIAISEADNGDRFTAVLRLAEALNLDEGRGRSGHEHRARLAAELSRCPRLLRLQTHDEQVVCTNLTAAGGSYATVTADHKVTVWDVLTGQPGGPALSLNEDMRPDALSGDGQLLATIDGDAMVWVWDVPAGKSVARLPASGEAVSRVSFPGGHVVLTKQKDGTVRRWDLAAEGPVLLPSPWTNPASRFALSADARWLFSVDRARTGQMWDMTNGEAAGLPQKVEEDMTPVAVSADGGRVVMVGPDRRLRVWDLATAKWLSELWGLTPPDVRLEGISADGASVITTGPGHRAHVRWAGSGLLFEVPSHEGEQLTYARFCPDSQFLIVARGTAARVWHPAMGRAVTPVLRHGTPVVAATYIKDRGQVVTISQAGTVRVWQLPPQHADGDREPAWDLASEEHSRAEIMAWARLLACARINDKQEREAMDERDLRTVWESVTKDGSHPP